MSSHTIISDKLVSRKTLKNNEYWGVLDLVSHDMLFPNFNRRQVRDHARSLNRRAGTRRYQPVKLILAKA